MLCKGLILLTLVSLLCQWSVIADDCDQTLDVAIVGAGIAGANSAYQLRNHGKDIAVFEISGRVGGRLYTVHLDETRDLPLEFGGQGYIVGDHTLFPKLMEELNIPAVPAFKEGPPPQTSFYLRGKRVPIMDFVQGKVPYDLNKGERANVFRLQRYYIEQFLGKPTPKNGYTREELMTLKTKDGKLVYELTIDEALEGIASPDGKELMRALRFFDTDLDSDSAIRFVDWYTSKAFSGMALMKRPKNDLATIPRTLIKSFLQASDSHSLKLHMKLISIDERDADGHYHLTFSKTDTTDGYIHEKDPAEVHHVCAKDVILALNLPRLVDIDWAPLRSERMQWAIEGRNVVPAGKIFMTFANAWWLTHTNNTDQMIINDLPLKPLFDYRKSEETNAYAISATYNFANDALDVAALNDGPSMAGSVCGQNHVSVEVKETILEHIAELMNIPREDIPEPLSASSQFWSAYPFEGSWTSTKAGYSMDKIVSVTRRPDENERVFVAGADHSFGQMALWAEGALETSQDVIDMYFKK